MSIFKKLFGIVSPVDPVEWSVDAISHDGFTRWGTSGTGVDFEDAEVSARAQEGFYERRGASQLRVVVDGKELDNILAKLDRLYGKKP